MLTKTEHIIEKKTFPYSIKQKLQKKQHNKKWCVQHLIPKIKEQPKSKKKTILENLQYRSKKKSAKTTYNDSPTIAEKNGCCSLT